MTLFIVVSFLAIKAGSADAAGNCTSCHHVQVTGAHARISCALCHGNESNPAVNPASLASGAAGCTVCHRGYAALFDHAMGTRAGEKAFVARSWGKADPHFWDKNCNSCHVTSCLDCHGGKGHAVVLPTKKMCLACHKGYFIGMDYYGRAPREDSLRYQRGINIDGERYLKMLPDVHAEAGMGCGACHSMRSLAEGKKTSKKCLDCHRLNKKIVEHRIAGHLNKLECYACHSSWGAQEYGTFYLRFTDSPSRDYYRLKNSGNEYVKSAYLRKQDAPPLGINERGKVSPIRPQFMAYFSDIRHDKPFGPENRLLAAEWKAFFPHTIRRGTVMCDGCHDNPRRFIQESKEDRIYLLQKDGMILPSFWDRTGQRVANGDFMAVARFRKMTGKSPAYKKAYIEKWKSLVSRGENSSLP